MAKDRSHLTPVVRADKNNVARTVYVNPSSSTAGKMMMVPRVAMSDPYYEDMDDDYSTVFDNTWGSEGFTTRDANDWMDHGFEDPQEAANWRKCVSHPDFAADLKFNGVQIGWASRWMRVWNDIAGHYTMEQMVEMIGPNPSLAEVYAKHFEPDEWGYAAAAGVKEHTARTVVQLIQGIALRQRGEDGIDLPEAYRTASIWAAATANHDDARIQIINRLMDRGVPVRKATNILGDTGDSDIYSQEGIKNEEINWALQADEWTEQVGFTKKRDGSPAYRALFTGLKSDASTMEHLISKYGVKKAVDSLSSGFTPTQALHHLEHGGVAEISKGVL